MTQWLLGFTLIGCAGTDASSEPGTSQNQLELDASFIAMDTDCNPNAGKMMVCAFSDGVQPWKDARVHIKQGNADETIGITEKNGCYSQVLQVGFWDLKVRTLANDCETDWRSVEILSCYRTEVVFNLEDWCKDWSPN